jgi:hypothetical protein
MSEQWKHAKQLGSADRYIVTCGHQIVCQGLNERDAISVAALPDLVEAAEPLVQNHVIPDDWPDDAYTGRMLTAGQIRALRSALLKEKGGEG